MDVAQDEGVEQDGVERDLGGPVRVGWWLLARDVVGAVAVLLVAVGAAALAGGGGRAVLVALVVVCGVGVPLRARARMRAQLRQDLLVALGPYLKVTQPGPGTVRLDRWRGFWPGTPDRVRIRHHPAVDETKQGWAGVVAGLTGRRLRCRYQVAGHDRRRCVLVLTRQDPEPARPALVTRLERTVADLLGPTATVTEMRVVDGHLTGFTVRHKIAAKLAATGYRARVERTIGVVHPGHWRARWNMAGDSVVFELRPPFPESVWLPQVQLDSTMDPLVTYDRVQIPIGIDEDGNELVWRPAIDPNLMVVGAPGTGKTVAEHTILTGVAQYGWPIWVLDGKAIEFLGFQDWPNVQIVGSRVEVQVALIDKAHALMEHRYQLITTGQAVEADFEPFMLFVDEWSDFRANLLDWYATVKTKGDPTKPPVLAKLASIARKGRSGRVHLLFATQRPDAEYFGGDMRDNFRFRISCGRLSPQGAMMMWQNPTVGTTVPRNRRGRATSINDHNEPIEIQIYRVLDPRRATTQEDRARVGGLRPTHTRHQRLVIVPPEPNPETPDTDPGYRDWIGATWATAAARPDLAPALADPDADPQVRAAARRAASPLTMLGIPTDQDQDNPGVGKTLTGTGQDGGGPGRPHLYAVPTAPAGEGYVDTFTDDDTLIGDPDRVGDDGYGPVIDDIAAALGIGDLIQVDDDPDGGRWAVIDEEPGPDPAAPDAWAIPWRDDNDDTGILSVPQDEILTVRHPTEGDAPPA